MEQKLEDTATCLSMCAMVSCPNTSETNPNIKFHNFPQTSDLTEIWMEKCGLPQQYNAKYLQICSNHFSSDCFFENFELKPNSIPTENPFLSVKNERNLNFSSLKETIDVKDNLVAEFNKIEYEYNEIKKKIDYYNKKIKRKQKQLNIFEKLVKKYKHRKNINNLLNKVFSQAQIDVLLNKKKVCWSYDDLAMAFTLRHIGSKECYLYLKNSLNLPLPSLACVQKWMASNKQ